MKIKSIKFYFENFDHVDIDGKYIGSIYMSDFNQMIIGYGMAVSKVNNVNKLALCIHKNANVQVVPNYMEGAPMYYTFDRLDYGDITSVDIEFDEGAVESYHVDYQEDENGYNSCQKTYVSDIGNLHLVIDAWRDVENYWDDTIDQKEFNVMCFGGDVDESNK